MVYCRYRVLHLGWTDASSRPAFCGTMATRDTPGLSHAPSPRPFITVSSILQSTLTPQPPHLRDRQAGEVLIHDELIADAERANGLR